VSKIAAAGFVDELVTLVGEALEEIPVPGTPGGQDYVAVVQLTHDQRGITVNAVSVDAGTLMVAPVTEPPLTSPGTSEHPVDWVDHLPAG